MSVSNLKTTVYNKVRILLINVSNVRIIITRMQMDFVSKVLSPTVGSMTRPKSMFVCVTSIDLSIL